MNRGFIGLGNMGAPMAGALRAAGHELFVATRPKVPPARVRALELLAVHPVAPG